VEKYRTAGQATGDSVAEYLRLQTRTHTM